MSILDAPEKLLPLIDRHGEPAMKAGVNEIIDVDEARPRSRSRRKPISRVRHPRPAAGADAGERAAVERAVDRGHVGASTAGTT